MGRGGKVWEGEERVMGSGGGERCEEWMRGEVWGGGSTQFNQI